MLFCYSFDEEDFTLGGETIGEAIAEAISESGDHNCFWIGEAVPPTPPEELWHAEDWLEHVSCQDDYGGEWAEDWDSSTPLERAELETEVRAVMAAWLDKYKNRPRHFCVENIAKFVIEDGIAVPAVKPGE